jgi:ribonuclease J
MTGSQGEPRSALARVASGQHPDVDLDKNDVVIFSSRVIPGNEWSISALQNKLVQAGVKIVTSHEEDIHVSGHPARDELKKMYEWVRPKVLIPVHGEVRHMQEQATYALECGVPKSLTPYNGTLVKLDADNPQIIGHVHTGRLGYDGGRMIPIESMLLKERSKMSINGAVFVTIPVDRNGILVRQIQLTTLGICLTEEEEDQLAQDIHRVIRKELDEFCPDEEERLENLTLAIRRIVKTRYDKKPLVSVHMVQV